MTTSMNNAPSAAPGGDASVEGNNSTALGGDGGDTVHALGGPGGHARVVGDRSTGRGGTGGRGGIGPGGPGGDAEVCGNDTFYVGGQGGESNQHDGRGGRGGRAYGVDQLGEFPIGHMKVPYGEPNVEPGRGGDTADSTQYMARRLIVEDIKASYFWSNDIPTSGNRVWYDRNLVPLDWINACVAEQRHRWRVSVVAGEYEFAKAF